MSASADRIRAAFREAALGLLEWQDPPAECPLCGRWATIEGRQLHAAGCHFDVKRRLRPLGKETLYGTAAEAEPFDVEADWNELA